MRSWYRSGYGGGAFPAVSSLDCTKCTGQTAYIMHACMAVWKLSLEHGIAICEQFLALSPTYGSCDFWQTCFSLCLDVVQFTHPSSLLNKTYCNAKASSRKVAKLARTAACLLKDYLAADLFILVAAVVDCSSYASPVARRSW